MNFPHLSRQISLNYPTNKTPTLPRTCTGLRLQRTEDVFKPPWIPLSMADWDPMQYCMGYNSFFSLTIFSFFHFLLFCFFNNFLLSGWDWKLTLTFNLNHSISIACNTYCMGFQSIHGYLMQEFQQLSHASLHVSIS